MKHIIARSLLGAALVSAAACDSKPKMQAAPDTAPPATAPAVDAATVPDPADHKDGAAPDPGKPTAADATAFIADLNVRLLSLKARFETADYIKSTYITPDTERNAASAQADQMAYLSEAIPKAATFRDLALGKDARRTLELLRTSPTLPGPADKAKREELAGLAAQLEGFYGAAKSCKPGPTTKDGKPGPEVCRDLGDLSNALEDPKASWDDLVDAWVSWHATAAAQRPRYERLTELGNEGAKELGFKDMGDLWRSGYDMSAADFEAEIDRLWNQVRPLYEKLHCLVRDRLSKKWGADKVPASGPIPSHVLGNMWAQDWSSVYPLVAPYPKAPATDITKAIAAKKLDAKAIVKIGEGFFVSLGLPKLPETFWANSQFTKPRDRDVVCHAAATDVTYKGEVRLKMCIEGSADDLFTVHHELGHIYYFLAYMDQPILFENGANDGFHEAIGDTMALSVTPSYLAELGLMTKATGDVSASPAVAKADAETARQAMLDEQMKRALEKVAFLPFGRLIDQWRWDVQSGKLPKDKWNSGWWDLKAKVQGIAPPVARSESDFDPAAKYHVAASVPYIRYFLAAILQFQFHRALCKAADFKGPLNECSIFDNKEAGKRLQAMLAAGASRPWQESLAALTGEKQMDASAILDYFAPLSAWLDEQTKGLTCGY